MDRLTLGLDVGPASIGWALIHTEEEGHGGKVVAAGVRVFPEGVDRDQQGGEQSKSQARRVARGMRRQIARRAARKRRLREVLTAAGLLPADSSQLSQLMEREPYELRARAIRERLDPFEIGRVLLHLAQRRGFLSNRRTDRGKEEKGMLAEISGLQKRIEESGCKTLGDYLYRLGSTNNGTNTNSPGMDRDPVSTIRRRHTRRDMYIAEFEEIWKTQKAHHPSLLTDDLHRCLYDPTADAKWVCKGLIFGQRRMYWPAEFVGRCELEPRHKRCLVGERCAQRFRILQEVNNLRLIDRVSGEERRLTPEERQTLIAYLSESEKRTFDQIRKKLGFHEQVRFNLEGPDRKELKGHVTDTRLSKAIGKKRWAALNEATRDQIAHVVLEEEREEEGLPKLQVLGLSPNEARQALAVVLPDARASLSRVAIEKLLPHLEAGKFYMGKDASDSALHAAGYLRPDQIVVRPRRFLPPPPDLPNPIVRGAMVEVRRVVNAILREICDAPPERGGLGGRRPDAIHIELAREAKKSFEERRRMRFENWERRREREEAAHEIEKHGGRATPGMIRKYLLWKEQGGVCVYSGRSISLAQVLSGEADVDHILPRWRSLDDSMMNKVLCFREENLAKGQRTPREWLERAQPEKWQAVLRRAEKLPYTKLKRFLAQNVVLEDFVKRQLQDTAYISLAVSQYLKCLNIIIVTPRGGMTAELRRYWGLNNILSDDGEKTRADHRHHAVDAAVIALTTPQRLHALANERGEHVAPPWPTLRADLERVVLAINVSHKALRRLRGALHEDTFYGATQKREGGAVIAPGSQTRQHAKEWIEDSQTVVRRKFVSEITDLKHLAKVRDRGIREVLKRHLASKFGVDTSARKGALPKKCFEGENTPRMPSGVPIRRVRMLEEGTTFRPVSNRRAFELVKPGSNHHVVYRECPDGRWIAEVIPMWEVADRVRRRGLPMVDRHTTRTGRFIMSLSIGEMFEINGSNGNRLLCTVRKLDQRSGRLYYKTHTDAREAKELDEENLYLSPKNMRERQARKVAVDPIGRIRRAND